MGWQHQDFYTVRDVEEKLDELKEERQGLEDEVEEAHDAMVYNNDPDAVPDLSMAHHDAVEAFAAWVKDHGDELAALQTFYDELVDYGDRYDSIITEENFEQHIRDDAECAARGLDFDSSPLKYIDWEKAADELKADYAYAEYDGTTYWILCS